MKVKEISSICKALSDVNRLKIIELLVSKELCGCDLLEELDISQSTLSYHMKILSESAIINSRPEGKWIYYSIDNRRYQEFVEYISILGNKLYGGKHD